MKNEHDIKAIETAFEKIIINKVFKRSSLQERILRYLINEALSGKDVKEYSIGVELFQEKYTASQNDSKIRSYVFYLRKKLDEYYKGQGRNETIIFYIEKGQYNLTFNENPTLTNTNKKKNFIRLQKRPILYTLISIITLTTGLILATIPIQPPNIWKTIFKENTICIVADNYMVANQYKSNKYMFSSIKNVNNKVDLSLFIKDNPDLSLKPANFTMSTKMGAFGIHYLNQWFRAYDESFDIQLESETQFSDYNKANIIYIGQAKNMQASRPFFLRNSKIFELAPNGFLCKQGQKTKHYTGTHNNLTSQEYAMVSYQKLDNGKFNIFFISNHDIGVIRLIKMFTSKSNLKEFTNQLPSLDSQFNVLYKVTGLKRTEIECELVELEILE